jgi:PhnB protein
MARVSTYLNFAGQTEEAFLFYRDVFGTEFEAPIMRMGDIPPDPSMPELADAEKIRVMHVALPITGGHVLMGTDTLESMGHTLTFGDNVSINLEPDTRAETDRLFAGLAEGATDVMGLQDMFWGSYFGTLRDKYGVRWMFNCDEAAAG